MLSGDEQYDGDEDDNSDNCDQESIASLTRESCHRAVAGGEEKGEAEEKQEPRAQSS